jgi:hypothetical protein
MKANLATWFVSDQLQETCACSSLGFRGKVKNCKAARKEKGGSYG